MKKLFGILLIILISTQLVFAGVISAKDAAKLSRKGEAIIVSARNHSDYASRHIKDAVNIYHKDLYKEDGITAMLKDPAEIAKVFGEKGITNDSKIIIYDNGDNKLAGRLYWIFEYLGAKDVNILDGHVKSWMKRRKPITKKKTEVTPANFKAMPEASKIATMEYVKSNMDKAILIDVRSKEEFDGKNEDEKLERKGHIPGGIHFNYENVINDDGTIKKKDEIAGALEKAGISADKELIIYCATSVRAGVVYMALTAIMEFPKVRVYDGAFYQWESVKDNPINN